MPPPRLHPPARLASLAFLVLFAFAFLAARAEPVWTAVEWRGERAWASTSRGWTAIVSEERARLISLSPADHDANLLFADLKNEFSWGGHRFWLGPQSTWKTSWPPPTDWERSPAASVRAEGSVLRVIHPRTDPAYPPIVRTYAWHDRVLHCTASWSDPRFQGIHILQLPSHAIVRLKRDVTAALPLGYALLPIYGRDGIHTDREIAPAVARLTNDELVLRYANVAEKIGVPPQEIVAEIGAHRLSLRRGRMDGMSATLPDLGMLTQVFLGYDESPFTEIEQLTPLGGDGEVVSEILLEPTVLTCVLK